MMSKISLRLPSGRTKRASQWDGCQVYFHLVSVQVQSGLDGDSLPGGETETETGADGCCWPLVVVVVSGGGLAAFSSGGRNQRAEPKTSQESGKQRTLSKLIRLQSFCGLRLCVYLLCAPCTRQSPLAQVNNKWPGANSLKFDFKQTIPNN